MYYYGPNVGFQYLFYDNNVTSAAQSNNFNWGSLGASQAWFSIDVSVSTPQSSDNTLFKLYQGQNAVYNFVAYVDVQSNGTNAPTSFKKRMTVQSSGANQNSQFTAQVQIAGPTPSSQQPVQPEQSPNGGSSAPNGQISASNVVKFTFMTFVVSLVACLM